MAHQFAKYNPVRLVNWMEKHSVHSPAIEHYLEVLTGSLAEAHRQVSAQWNEEDRIAGSDCCKNRDRSTGDILLHVGRISDYCMAGDSNNAFVNAIITRAIANNPQPRAVAKYMDDYVANFDQ